MSTTAFPIVTYATWSQRIDDATSNALTTELDALYNSGKTDNVVDLKVQSTADGKLIEIRRNWLDLDTANGWISFIQSLNSPYLVSITIE